MLNSRLYRPVKVISAVVFSFSACHLFNQSKDKVVITVGSRQQIVVKTLEEAKMINSLLAKGEDMGRWAEKYSITPDAKTGGIMGWIARGQLETVESAVFALPIEKRSGILKSSYGHHIFGDKGRELYFLE